MAKSKTPLHLCFDRPVASQHTVAAAKIAISENKGNQPPPLVLGPGASSHPLSMALFTGKMWPSSGKTLGVRFLDGSKTQRKLAQKYANEWTQFANVTFKFNGGASSEIRISFQADPGSWSAVGTDCLVTGTFPKNQPTMNFGWLKDDTDPVEWRRVVVHEFGHALGAIHEHQNPKGGIQWNLPAVYATFSGPPNNWSKDEIDFNIVQKYSIDQLNATEYDPESIMLYSFPAQLIIGGVATANNTDLSDEDKKFIGTNYPKKGAAKPAKQSVAAAAAAPKLKSGQRVHPGFPKFA